MSSPSFEAIDRVLDSGGDADDILRAVVDALAGEPGIAWAGVRFLETGELALGPSAGSPEEARRHSIPIVFRGERVGELVVDGEADRALLDGVAERISEYVLLGWDTGGSAWEP